MRSDSGSGEGRVVINDTNTAVQLSSVQVAIKLVVIQALPTNSNVIAVGCTRGKVRAASLENPSVITAPKHGLSTGARVSISGSYVTDWNGKYLIIVIDDDTFSLTGLDATTFDDFCDDGNCVFTQISTEAGIEVGDRIFPNNSTVINISDLSKVWINGTAGEGVTYRYEKA